MRSKEAFGLFEHRIFLLSSSVNGPSKRIIQAARPAG
jgi:hypothetical protein